MVLRAVAQSAAPPKSHTSRHIKHHFPLKQQSILSLNTKPSMSISWYCPPPHLNCSSEAVLTWHTRTQSTPTPESKPELNQTWETWSYSHNTWVMIVSLSTNYPGLISLPILCVRSLTLFPPSDSVTSKKIEACQTLDLASISTILYYYLNEVPF